MKANNITRLADALNVLDLRLEKYDRLGTADRHVMLEQYLEVFIFSYKALKEIKGISISVDDSVSYSVAIKETMKIIPVSGIVTYKGLKGLKKIRNLLVHQINDYIRNSEQLLQDMDEYGENFTRVTNEIKRYFLPHFEKYGIGVELIKVPERKSSFFDNL